MGQMLALDPAEIERLAAQSNYPEWGISGRCNYVTERGKLCLGLSGNKAQHAELALRAGIDVVWIGARTTACPFVTQEIAEALRGTDIPVFVKNPASVDLDLWIGAVERFARCGLSRLGAILRGFKTFIRPDDTCPPYRNTLFWEVADRFRAELPGLPMLCDPSHIGGARCHIAPLSREALSRGYDGLIIETHCNPAEAMTDAAQQLTPEALARLMESIAVPV